MFRMHGICAVDRNGFQEGSIGGSIRERSFSHTEEGMLLLDQ